MEWDGSFIDVKLNLQQQQQRRLPPALQRDPIFQPFDMDCNMAPQGSQADKKWSLQTALLQPPVSS